MVGLFSLLVITGLTCDCLVRAGPLSTRTSSAHSVGPPTSLAPNDGFSCHPVRKPSSLTRWATCHSPWPHRNSRACVTLTSSNPPARRCSCRVVGTIRCTMKRTRYRSITIGSTAAMWRPFGGYCARCVSRCATRSMTVATWTTLKDIAS